MAKAVPVMSTERARTELDWGESKTSVAALEELITGLREGSGLPTPALKPSSLSGRVAEVVKTGVGTRQPNETQNSRLVKYLTDAHSIESQAMVQMRKAPELAGDPSLATIFSEHEKETATHRQLIADRLRAHQAKPSTGKDVAGKTGGSAMLLFAGSQPDTPGKLCAHAYSYEHMEAAAYELLQRIASAEGDLETAEAARAIGAEERCAGWQSGRAIPTRWPWPTGS